MRRIAILLLTLLTFLPISAQRITQQYNNVSLSDALLQLNEMQKAYTVNFIYNELEDFRVTTNISRKPVAEAIQQLIGFYPVRMTINNEAREIYVECTHKTERHITGRIIDPESQPVAYANVALLSPKDSTLLSGGVSNESGVFVIPTEQLPVLVRISFIGYKTILRLYDKENLGTIRMEGEAYQLSGVTVKGELPKYRMTKGGYTSNVEGTVLADLGTGLDVLGQLPRVQENNGKISISGKSGRPLIYINGRRMRDREELRQMKSQDIKSIEVITTPGAQYPANVSSVIRIKTIRRQGEGLSSSLSHYSRWTAKHTAFDYLRLNYRWNRLDVFANLNYTNYFWRVEDESDDVFIGNQHTIGEHKTWQMSERLQQLSGNAGFSYQIGSDHYIGMRLDLSRTYPEDYHPVRSTMVYTTDGQPSGTIVSEGEEKAETGVNPTLDAYYIGKVAKTDISLNLTWLRRKTNNEDWTSETSREYGDQKVTTLHDSHSRMWAGKLVLTTPLADGLNLEYGTEYTNSHSTQKYQNPEQIVRSSDNEMQEQMLAGFAEVEFNYKKWLFSLGARFEHNRVRYYDNDMLVPEQSRSENHWMPTFNIGWNRGKWQHRLGMRTLVYRPTYSNLTNDITYSGHFRYRGGNPGLKTMYNYDFEYNLAWRWLNFTAEYGYMVDSHTNYAQPFDDTSDIMFATFLNVPHRQQLRFIVTASPHFGPWYPSLTLECYRQFFNASAYGVTENLEKPSLELTFNNMLRLKHDWTLRLNFTCNTPAYFQFVERRPQQVLSLHVNKYFFNKHLLASLSINDMLKTGNYNINLYNGRYTHHLHEYQQSRYLQLGLVYYLNTTRTKYRGTGAGNAEKNRL